MAKSKQACDVCHKRKIQCDLSGPGSKCDWCLHHDMPCTFSRVRGRKNPRPKRDVFREDVIQRIGRIEEFVARTGGALSGSPAGDLSATAATTSSERTRPSSEQTGGSSPDAPKNSVSESEFQAWRSSSDANRPALGNIYFSGCYIGSIDHQSSIPSLSEVGRRWIFSATGKWPSFPATLGNDARAPHRHPRPATVFSLSLCGDRSPTELPDILFVKSKVQQFLASDYIHTMPILDPLLFEETMRQAYTPATAVPTIENIAARACVFAFLSLTGIHFTEAASCDLPVDSDSYASEAQVLVSQVLEDGNLTTLQALIMLKLYHVTTGRLQIGSMYHALACRMLFALGAHAPEAFPRPDRELSLEERKSHQLRNFFWFAYILDKEIALRTCQPPIICDEFCDLTLPHGYPDKTATAHVPTGLPPMLPGDVRMSIIKSRTFQLLYSVRALRKSDAELLRSIRELDEELEAWRVSLPKEFSPALSIPEHKGRPAVDLGAAKTTQHIMLHLEYHHLMTVIHCASGRCLRASYGTPDVSIMGLRSSLELSVQASRATLIYLNVAIHTFPAETFWIIIFYPMSSLITVFFNILLNPMGEEAESDAELLGTVGALVQTTSAKYIAAQRETARLEGLNLFIKELCELARCAIAKSRSGSGQGTAPGEVELPVGLGRR